MKISKEENYWILEDEKNNAKDFAEFLSDQGYQQISNQNLVIDLLKYQDLSLEELLEFLALSNKHRAEKHSFVIVNKAISVDQAPEELLVVPTLGEAGDLIQMEEIERDLGAF